MFTRRLSALLIMAVQCAAAQGASTGGHDTTRADVARYQSWRSAAATAIAQRGDANSLAAAAALGYLGGTGHADALDWAAHAAAAKPDDPAIGWLRLELCAGTPRCDIRDAATTLRWIDADNGAAWLPSLNVAVRDGDATEVNRMLGEMAGAKRFDLYWNRLVTLLFDVLRHERGSLPAGYIGSDVARLSEAISVLSVETLPPFGALQNTCRDAPAGERRESCLRLARVMQHGDAIVTQLAGFGLERRVVAADSREAHTIAERRAVLLWRRASANQFEATALPWLKNSQARAVVSRMRRTAREEDVCIAALRAHGLPLDPPGTGH